jgi:hypothetical protein
MNEQKDEVKHFLLDSNQANEILAVLLELPARISFGLIQMMQSLRVVTYVDKPAEAPIENAATEQLGGMQ